MMRDSLYPARDDLPASRWRCGSHLLSCDRPLLMGILNVTPDSFSDGGLHDTPDAALQHAAEMLGAGADLVDVGGESTRPGSDEVPVQEELSRVLPVVRALAERDVVVSVDTRHAAVAEACVGAGAAVINDVSGFRDPRMREVAARCGAGLVVMHMAGTPKHMQDDPCYDDVVSEVAGYLARQARLLESEGVAHDRICLDPGFGFGKTTRHNDELLERFDELCRYGCPVMVALSRKRFIGELYGRSAPRERTWGSVARALAAVERGARVIRVHDVAETHEALLRLEEEPVSALIALGANQGDRVGALSAACLEIDALPFTSVEEVSSIYGSEPAYHIDQPPFANAVLRVRTRLHERVLLAELQRLELAAGRVRTFANAPRPLDLDILDYEGVVSDDAELTLPHPRLLERDFTVRPILEMAPGYVLADGTAVTDGAVRHGMTTGVLSEPGSWSGGRGR